MKKTYRLVLIALLLAGCGTPSTSSTEQGRDAPATAPASSTSTAKTVLQFAVSGFQSEQYSDLIDAFESENPDVHISVVSIEDTLGTGPMSSSWPDDAYTRLAAAADVIAATATRQAVQQGALLDLSEFFASDSTLTPDAFYPGLLESVQYDGKTWSVPVEASYQMIYYDKALFDRAGVAYPQPGWTWDDFLATAKALTVGSGDSVTQWGFVQPSFDPVTIVEARAGLLFDSSVNPPTARLSDAAVAEAVRWYTDLFLTHEVSPYHSQADQGGPGRMFSNEGMRLIESGQAAMWFGANFQSFRVGGPDNQQQTTGVVPMPVDQAGDHSTLATVSGFSISAGTQKADLAWRWIRYLAQAQGGQRRGPQGGRQIFVQSSSSGTSLPAMPSVAAAAGTWDNLDEGASAALKYAVDHAFIDTYDGTGYDTFTQAVVSVMDDGAAIETALADAQSQVETDIAAEVDAAPTPVAGLVVAEEEQRALNAGAVIIDFGTSEGRFGGQSMTTLIDQFQAEHPDIIVEAGEPRGFEDTSLAGLAEQYDCFQAAPALNDESITSVVNLEPFLASDSTTRKEDFFPSVLEQFTYQGQVWGLPGSVTISVMNYNKDVFDAANVPYPTADWTTSDFLDKAVALTQGEDEDKVYGYVPSSFGVNDLIVMLDRLGADMLDESTDPPRLVFTTSTTIDAFRWFTSLATQYKVEPAASEDAGQPGGGPPHNESLINEGRAAMWMDAGTGMGFRGFGGIVVQGGPGGPGGTSTLNTGVVPLPAGLNSAKGSGFQSVTGYFISAQTAARQACWTWISFLTQQPTAVSGLPGRQSVAQSDEYRQRVGADRADAYLVSISSGSRASFFQRLSDADNWLRFATMWLSDAYSRVISGETTVDEALDAVQQRVDSYRNCVIAQDAYQDPEKMMQCMGEVGGTIGRPPGP